MLLTAEYRHANYLQCSLILVLRMLEEIKYLNCTSMGLRCKTPGPSTSWPADWPGIDTTVYTKPSGARNLSK
jgi:hypothetical protein